MKTIIKLLTVIFPEAKIYLFGSRARGDFQEHSDIDIALDGKRKLESIEVGQAREMLNASNIPLKIEVVDLHRVPEAMKQNILREGIEWKN